VIELQSEMRRREREGIKEREMLQLTDASSQVGGKWQLPQGVHWATGKCKKNLGHGLTRFGAKFRFSEFYSTFFHAFAFFALKYA